MADVIEDAAKKATHTVDSTIQNMGNQMIAEGSHNLDKEVKNVSQDMMDSASSEIHSQIANALP